MTKKEARNTLKAIRKAHYNELQVPQVIDTLTLVIDYILTNMPSAGEENEG